MFSNCNIPEKTQQYFPLTLKVHDRLMLIYVSFKDIILM